MNKSIINTILIENGNDLDLDQMISFEFNIYIKNLFINFFTIFFKTYYIMLNVNIGILY